MLVFILTVIDFDERGFQVLVSFAARAVYGDK